jgi:hypothetical protein
VVDEADGLKPSKLPSISSTIEGVECELPGVIVDERNEAMEDACRDLLVGCAAEDDDVEGCCGLFC